jgi:glycosyltransferase involved in cell wall biosynthesis
LFLHKFLARRALTNIVTDEHWQDLESSWGARSFILENIPTQLPKGENLSLENDKFSVAMSHTFAQDEPLDLVLEAAGQLPEIHFYITGDKSRKNRDCFANQPDNVTFTGFLSEAKYIGLLRAVHAVMALTTRDHTMQLGACEALLLGKPIITSDWKILRRYFCKGTVHVSPTSSDGIRKGILKMQRERERFEREILDLREERKREWQKKISELKGLINEKYRR